VARCRFNLVMVGSRIYCRFSWPWGRVSFRISFSFDGDENHMRAFIRDDFAARADKVKTPMLVLLGRARFTF
jgi:hypothetical protein